MTLGNVDMRKPDSVAVAVPVAVVALALLLGSSAGAQLGVAEQKCIDEYNNRVRLVGQQAGKDYGKCIRNAGKGSELDPDHCVNDDIPGKIAGKTAKLVALYADGKCTGLEPIQQGATVGSDAAIDATHKLVRDLFGNPIGGVVNPGKDEAKCQGKAHQRAQQLFTENLKEFRKCKQDGMEVGVVLNSVNLESACMTPAIPDLSGKIVKKAGKLTGDVTSVCAGLSVGQTFPGLLQTPHPGICALAVSNDSATALGECIEERVNCRVCDALNEADGTDVDCDLFDNGVIEGSCSDDL